MIRNVPTARPAAGWYPESIMTAYEIWDTESRNLVEWFDTRAELLAALRSGLDVTGTMLALRHRDGTLVWIDPSCVTLVES